MMSAATAALYILRSLMIHHIRLLNLIWLSIDVMPTFFKSCIVHLESLRVAVVFLFCSFTMMAPIIAPKGILKPSRPLRVLRKK